MFTSGSPCGAMLVGALLIIAGTAFLFLGNPGTALFLLIPGIFILTAGICLQKYVQPKHGLKSLFSPCRYNQEKK